MTSKNYKCSLCKYESNKRYNLNRHMMAKHKNQDINISIHNGLNTVNDGLNTVSDGLNTVNDNKCSKCNKILSSKRCLKNHLLICKGVSNPLECHICHKILYDSSSKSKHLKICREKSKELIVKPEEQLEPIKEIQTNHQLEVIPQIINNTQINNNCNNNITYNINLIRFDEEELKIEFDINHLEKNNIIHKLYIIDMEDAYRIFYKKLFENKNNQMTINRY